MTDTPIKEDTQPYAPVIPIAMRPEQPENKGGCGCWVTAIMTLLVAAVLVGIGLFLPPVNLYDRLFGVQYAMLSAEANAVAVDGLTVSVSPSDPGREFGVAMNSVPLNALNTNTNDAQIRNASTAGAAAPPHLALVSPTYHTETTGSSPESVTLTVRVPQTAGNPDVLDLYSWNEDTLTWEFIPAWYDGNGSLIATVDDVPENVALFQSMPPDQPTILVSVDVTQTLTPEVAELATIVSPAGLQPTLEGKLTGSLAAGFDQNAGYDVMPVIRNFIDPRAV